MGLTYVVNFITFLSCFLNL